MARRFEPAVATCQTVSARLHDLSERVAQASGLLSTRVDIARERQNQALLSSMDRRAKLQLRLQQTVEGLSVAAIVYYVAGLVGYVTKGAKAGGLPLNADLVIGLAVPVVAAAGPAGGAPRAPPPALSLQRHRRPGRDETGHPVAAVDPSVGGVLVFRRPRHRQVHRRARAGRAAAEDARGGRLPLRLRPCRRPAACCADCAAAPASASRQDGIWCRCRWSTCRWAPPKTAWSARWIWSGADAGRQGLRARACWRAPTAASCTSTRSTCWKTTWSTC
jgi:hypothetical protein